MPGPRSGRARAVCLGVGLDALTLAATILTVSVIDADVFAERNATRPLRREPMASPGAACLALAWQHKIALLAR